MPLEHVDFLKAMAVLFDGLAKPLPQETTLKVWFGLLRELDASALNGAVLRFLRVGDDWPTVAKLLRLVDSGPSPEDRARIAYQALRRAIAKVGFYQSCDFDWERNRMRVPSPKTAHHGPEHASRIVPIFPELRRFLEDAFDAAAPGATHCVPTYQRDSRYQFLGKPFETIIRRAGLTPWPRVFHNLRATRQTELSATFPAHVVCGWLGNSVAIAQEHYLRTTDDDFAKAATVPTGALAKSASDDAESDAPDDARNDAESIRRDRNGTRVAHDGAMSDRPRVARKPEKTGLRSRPCSSPRDAGEVTEAARPVTSGRWRRSASWTGRSR